MSDAAELLDALLPAGWEHDADVFGDDFTLVCPHGHELEQDGDCPEGCVSPIVSLGLI